jgi:signal transduction histidine kinase
MKLYTRLVIIMLSLLIMAVTILFFLNQQSQSELVEEIVDSSTEVSKAIQLSVADLTSEAEADPSHLSAYLATARKKGVTEVNIISNEGEIITSSDPTRIGKRWDVKRPRTGLKSLHQHGGDPSAPHLYDLLVPVIVGDQQLGYVQVNLLLDNIREIQHSNYLHRLVATSLVFIVGIVLAVVFARRYTSPIHHLAEEVKQVAAGDLSVSFATVRNDEIGQLATSLNEMVIQLKERKDLELRLAEAEHQSRAGQLAGGIAHEIKNPLNYISLAVDHLLSLQQEGVPPVETEKILCRIKEEVRSATYLLHNFMGFGRPLQLKVADFSLTELLATTLEAFSHRFADARIDFIFSASDDLPPLHADQQLLRTCIVNFVTNAIEAMPYGGKLSISAAYGVTNDQFAIMVSDTGEGIASDHLVRIFQPYFTTKDAGVGLGLAITERIIRAHGGQVTVSSSRGSGTTFIIQLPRHAANTDAPNLSDKEV